MKKTMMFICAATLALSAAFPKNKKHPPQELPAEVKQVVTLTDLSSLLTKELFEGNHPEIAIECKQGTELPLKYIGNYGLFSIHFAPNLSIRLEKTAYLRFMRTNPDKVKSLRGYISFDMKKWEKITGKALGGKPDVNFGFSKDKSSILLETTVTPLIESMED
jgi:hypothetical protein